MIIGYTLLIIALAELCLGLWFLTRKNRNQTMLWYGLFAISSAIYVGANGLGYATDQIMGRWAENLAWSGGAMATAFYLPFSYSLPISRRPLRELAILALWPVALFAPGFLFSNAFVIQQRMVNFGNGYETKQGPYMWFFLLFMAVYWIWSITNHFRVFTKGDSTTKRNVGIILVGTLGSLLVTTYFDVFIPLNEVSRIGFIGSIMTIFWLGSALYVLLKK